MMMHAQWFCGCLLVMAGLAAAQTTPTLSYKEEMMRSMEKMHQVISADRLTGDADKDFLIMMIPHHQGAVDMARLELKHGKDPAVQAMAKNIISAQEIEIRQMTEHLARLGGQATSTVSNKMHDPERIMHHMDHHAHSPQ